MKKRLLAFVLTLCVALALLPGAALAAEAAYGERTLTGADLWLYRELKDRITRIANGELDSSVFELDAAGQGITCSSSSIQGLDINRVFLLLVEDCPYEMYWYDGMKGYTYSYYYTNFKVTTLEMSMYVSQDYAVHTEDGKQYYHFRPDPQKTGAAAAVVRSARQVVAQYSGLSDYEKLAAYRDYICGQVSYNRAAGNNLDDYPYGDPWQLVYVFDSDPATNVVCEGYAKAFKYLCDLSSFNNRVECYTVSGDAGGRHMWNLVRINDCSYLVDVTNSDEDSVGMYGELFLAGTSNSTGDGFTVEIPRHDLGGGYYLEASSMSYTYRGEMKELFSADVLKLAPTGYTRGMSFTDVVAEEYYITPIDWAMERGIVMGYDDGRFGVGDDCTQIQILTFLWRAAGRPDSNAVPAVAVTENADYAGAARWATEKGMIGADFKPNAPCTRADAVKFIWQAMGAPRVGSASSFSDVSANAPYAGAVNWAVAKGVTQGTTATTFEPDKVCTRAQIVTFLHRAYK